MHISEAIGYLYAGVNLCGKWTPVWGLLGAPRYMAVLDIAVGFAVGCTRLSYRVGLGVIEALVPDRLAPHRSFCTSVPRFLQAAVTRSASFIFSTSFAIRSRFLILIPTFVSINSEWKKYYNYYYTALS